MNLIKPRDKTQQALQKTYEEAYQQSLQSILLETQNNRDAALQSWNLTLSTISQNLSALGDVPPKSATSQGLMASILDIERQCHDRITFLESRRHPATNPYLTSQLTTSSTLVSSDSSFNNTSGRSLSESGPSSTNLNLPLTRKHPPSKSDSAVVRTANSASHSASSLGSTMGSATPVPPSHMRTASGHSHSSSTSSTSTKYADSNSQRPDYSLRSRSAAELPPQQHQQKTMIKTLRTSGKSWKLGFGQRAPQSASQAASLAWTGEKPPQPSLTRPYNRSSAETVRPTARQPQRPASNPPSKPPTLKYPDIDSRPLIDLSDDLAPTSYISELQHLQLQTRPKAASTPAIVRSRGSPSPARSASPAKAAAPRQAPRTVAPAKPAAPAPRSRVAPPVTTKPAALRSTPNVTAKPVAARPVTKPAAKPAARPVAKPTAAPTSRPGSRQTTGVKKSPASTNIGPSGQKTRIKSDLFEGFSSDEAGADEEVELDPLVQWELEARAKVMAIKGIDQAAAEQILNEIVVNGDEVHWEDIAGLEQAKNSLKETVVYPFLRPDLFSGLREPARGMLLFGPPGTGKTMLARAVATESHSTFFSISASSLTSKFLGESEKLVRALFQMAKVLAPSIIFVDEIDSLLSQRSDSGEHEASRRIKTEFLIQWSDLQHAAAGKDHGGDLQRVLVLAATNLPWAIDEAARRRFVRRQYIPLPECDTRKAHLRKLMSHQKHAITDEQFADLLNLTEGFSGSDLTALAKDAAMGPLRSLGDALLTTPRDQIRSIGFDDFVSSIKTIRPSVSQEGLKEFENWAALYGSSGA